MIMIKAIIVDRLMLIVAWLNAWKNVKTPKAVLQHGIICRVVDIATLCGEVPLQEGAIERTAYILLPMHATLFMKVLLSSSVNILHCFNFYIFSGSFV